MRIESEDQARTVLHSTLASSRRRPMCARTAALSALIALAPLVVLVAAPKVSPQQADAFAKKLAIISAQSTLATRAATVRRTSVSEDEVNSWFAYRAQPLLPQGMSEPQLTIVGNGRV